MTSSNYQYLIPSGVIVADTSATLAEVQSEWQQSFGSDLIVTPDTPQGVMITAEALARDNVINNNAALANQINPNVAGGVFLDAIMALTGTQRNTNTPTLVSNVTLTGAAGTVIQQGSQAATAAGDIFQSTSSVTLNGEGTAQVNFQSIATGPIPCAANALTAVVSGPNGNPPVIGWETVLNNPDSSPASVTTLGNTTQSDQAARAYRLNTLAYNGISLAEAITSALYATPGVTSLTFQENIAGTTATINGITMGSHSVYACVAGGTDTAVAAALLENKSSGCGWNGGTTINVIEPASLQTYPVQFDRPAQKGILISVLAFNVTPAAVVQALLDYQAGTVSDPAGNPANLSGFGVGDDVLPFELAAAIAIENPGAQIQSLAISLSSGSPSYQTTPIAIGVNQQAYTQLSYITTNTG